MAISTPYAGGPISRDSRDLLPGAWLGQRFEVLARVGRGGAGWVYSAHDHKRDTRVALKVLSRRGGEQALRSCRREFKNAGSIEHENVVRVLGLERLSGRTVLTMELIEGESLRQVLKRKGRLAVTECLALVRQIAAGLDATHEQGIVHRDLKPGNVIVDRKGVARIADFGLSERIDGDDKRRFVPVGTPEYMAPEQVEGRRCGRETDLFALGVMIYEMLTGELPYRGASGLDTALERLRGPAPDPHRLVPSLPHWLCRLVLRCLEREPRDRVATVSELLAAIDSGDASDRDLPTRPLGKPPRFRSLRPLIALTALSLLIGIASWVAWNHARTPATPLAAFLADGEIRVTVQEPSPIHHDPGALLIGAGIADTIRTRLANQPGIAVMKPSASIEQILTVRVLRLGDRVRVSATVASKPDGRIFMTHEQVDAWQGTFDGIDRIAQAIVDAYVEEIATRR